MADAEVLTDPAATGPDRPGRRRSRWRSGRVALVLTSLVPVLALAGLLTDASWQDLPHRRASSDPGGVRLHLLQPVLQALPSDARVRDGAAAEPRWDSCDARPGTFGWTDVNLDSSFTTHQDPAVFFSRARAVLDRQGWVLTSHTDPWGKPVLSGHRPAPGAATATVVLSAAYEEPGAPVWYWALSARTSPAGPRVSGC